MINEFVLTQPSRLCYHKSASFTAEYVLHEPVAFTAEHKADSMH